MANSLWVDAVRKGLAANRPTVPDFPSNTFGFYLETDTGLLKYGVSGGSGWVDTTIAPQGTPTAKTGTATLTIAELRTGIVTATSASAVGITLPTGTLTDAGVGNPPIGSSFDWSIINLGSSSGAVTMNAGTDHTYVGGSTVAITTSAMFRTRKTAANTYVTYRLT